MSERSTVDDGRVVVLESASPRAIEWAAERLRDGGVIAIPTDTVYGVAASLAHPDAIARIYDLKGRPSHQPLPVLVSSTDIVPHLTLGVDHDIELLMARYWPGPLTVVVPAREGMPEAVTAGGKTVGVRMPNHPLAIEVIAKAGGAIACTSANLSGQPPARDAQEVASAIGSEVDLILDGGIAPGGVPSTVVEFIDGEPVIHREGAIPGDHIRETWRDLLAAHEPA